MGKTEKPKDPKDPKDPKEPPDPPAPSPDFEEGTIDPLELKLDLRNPRFIAYGSSKRSEDDVVKFLIQEADLAELVQSIAANGYKTFEPLVVLKDKETDDKLTVIEGNRRVAAIKLLRDPALAARVEFTTPTLQPDLEPSLKSARILKVKHRDLARQYIGFKHINGPHKWDSFSKGMYAATWYEKERGSGVTVADIARMLGDRHDTILRLVNGIFVLQQARKKRLFTIEGRYPGRQFFFSHLYTAITREQYREYLGLDAEWRQQEPKPDPVPEDKLPRLKQVMIWLYGSATDEIEPLVKSQNPHVKNLGEIIENPAALKVLESGSTLAEAHAEVETRAKKFSDKLLAASKYAQEAQQYVDAYDADPVLLEYAERIGKIGAGLFKSMSEAIADAEKRSKKNASKTKADGK